jgi:hypothetical protein
MSYPVQEEKAAAVTYTSSSSNPTTVKGMQEETEDEKTVPLLEDEHNADDDCDTTTPLLQPKKKIDIYNSVSEENKHLVKEAGQGGALVGFFAAGPIGAVVGGFGSAYAVRKPDGLGKAARSLGKVTLSAKTRAAPSVYGASRAIKKVTPNCVQAWSRKSWNSATNFTHDHQILERGVEGTGRGFEYLSRNLSRIQHRRHHHPAPITTTTASTSHTTTTIPYLFPGDDVASPPQGEAGWSPTECHRGYQPPMTTNEYTKLCAVEATAE